VTNQSLVLCVDFGSTFTKAALVDVSTGELIGVANHPTTIETDVLDGFEACRAALGSPDAPVMACSSAGGGLRIAVVGNEELVTAEAGRRVALSSGGKVVWVGYGGLAPGLADLKASEPDVILLVGGTDGGNSEVLIADATRLGAQQWTGPIVVAGDVEAQGEVSRLLQEAGTPYVIADNVVPRIGVLAPESARAAIREMFLKHVIGGKHLSAHGEFVEMVRGATPDVVLTGVEMLASLAGDVVVIDVGGATTDVHSVIELDPETGALGREVVAITPVTRTVEGDLGMRWSAATTVAAGIEADLVPESLRAAGQRRHDDPAYLPDSMAEVEADDAIAGAAVTLAVRRHCGRSRVVFGPDGRVVERSGKDLREVDVLVGSGGVLRHATPERAKRILGGAIGDSEDGWQYPQHPRLVVDSSYVLAAVGLLAPDYPDVARRLAATLIGADSL